MLVLSDTNSICCEVVKTEVRIRSKKSKTVNQITKKKQTKTEKTNNSLHKTLHRKLD